MVHFCISEYVTLLLDRIVQGSPSRAPDLPAAVLFDLYCFLNLGCQGSAVEGCLLTHPPTPLQKKTWFFFLSFIQWLIQSLRGGGGGCIQLQDVKPFSPPLLLPREILADIFWMVTSCAPLYIFNALELWDISERKAKEEEKKTIPNLGNC